MLRYKLLLMPEGTEALGGGGDDAGTPPETPAEEGTTPEEVREVLNLPPEKPTTDIPTDPKGNDEGDDPPADDDTDEDPLPDDDDTPADDELADDGKPTPTPEEVKAAQDARNAEVADKYSFEITDANGVVFKVPADATMEDVLDEFEPKNNGQIIDILEKLREVKDLKAKDEAAEASETAKTERAQRASEIQKGWQEESRDLQAQKRLPEGEDGDKRIAEVYKFMAEENDKRIKKNRPTIGSFEDALDKMENKEARDKKIADDKKDKENARKNGGLVGGSSHASTSATPIYKSGSANNANAALKSMGLLD